MTAQRALLEVFTVLEAVALCQDQNHTVVGLAAELSVIGPAPTLTLPPPRSGQDGPCTQDSSRGAAGSY